MEIKRKPRSGSTADSSTAVVKAAAWAWYERGSGSEAANATREYDATLRRSRGPPRPSRYKLEAMRAQSLIDNSTSHNNESEPKRALYDDANLSLLDEYEIRSISRQLDSFIENSRILYGKRDVVSSSDDDSVTTTTTITSTTRMIKRNMKKFIGGFWLRNGARVCSSGGDGGVVETAVVATRGPYVTHNSR